MEHWSRHPVSCVNQQVSLRLTTGNSVTTMSSDPHDRTVASQVHVGDRRVHGLGRGRGQDLRRGRHHPGAGGLRRSGRGHGHAAAQDRHGPGGLGREVGELRDRQRHGHADLLPRGGGAQLLVAGHRGARELAGAERRDDPRGRRGREPRACRPRPRRGPQGGLAEGVGRRRERPRRRGSPERDPGPGREEHRRRGREQRPADGERRQGGLGPGGRTTPTCWATRSASGRPSAGR